MPRQIILKTLEKPKEKKVSQDVIWFCDSLGFNSGRDIDMITSRIIGGLLENYARERVSSELLADELSLNIGRVNHHLRSLIDSGFLYRQNRLIHLRGGSMKSAVQEIRKDAERIFDDLERIAEEIDSAFGIKNRY